MSTTAPLHLRSLWELPQPLQAEILNHNIKFGGVDPLSEVIQQVCLELLEAGREDTIIAVWNRAQSNLRRFRKGSAGGRPVEGFSENFEYEVFQKTLSWKRAAVVKWISEEKNCSIRHARRLVDQALKSGCWDGRKRGGDE